MPNPESSSKHGQVTTPTKGETSLSIPTTSKVVRNLTTTPIQNVSPLEAATFTKVENTSDSSLDAPTKLQQLLSALKIIATSNSIYSATGSGVFTGFVSSAPEMAIFHLALGVISVRNEIKARLGFKSPDSSTIENNKSGLVKILESPGLYRVATAGVFAVSTLLAGWRGNNIDSIIFLCSALGCAAAAGITNKESGYAFLKDSSLLKRISTKVFNGLPNSIKNLFQDPGPSWLVADLMVGIRNLSADVLKNSAVLQTGLITAGVITAVGLTLSLANTILNKNIPKSLVTYFAAAQSGSMGIVNFLVGDYKMAGCLALWTISSVLIGRSLSKDKSN